MFWPGGEWRTIEEDVRTTVKQELDDQGFGWATVETKDRGRDVLLSGSAPSEESKSQAMEIASTLAQDEHGNPVARIVEWEGDIVIPEPDPGNLSFSAVDGQITLNGVVASEAQKQSLIDSATAVYGESNVVDRLTVKDNILEIENIGGLIDNFAMDNGTLRLSLDKVLRINGEVDSQELKSSIGKKLQTSLPEGYSLDNQLAVAIKGAPSVDILADNGKVTLNGELASEEQKTELFDSVAKNYGVNNVVDNLIVASNVLPVDNLGEIVGKFYLADGSMSLNNQVWKLTGEVESDAKKSDIGEKVQSVLPSDASLQNLLSIKAPDVSAICLGKVDDLMSDSKIYFETSKADVKAESYPLLDQIASILNECAETEVQVAGHTDSTGSAEVNQPLSLNRAQAVVEYLIAKGVSASRLSSAGFGSEQPIADNATNEGRAANRRIEFTVK